MSEEICPSCGRPARLPRWKRVLVEVIAVCGGIIAFSAVMLILHWAMGVLVEASK